uniref:Hydroxylysine kinase n=1 Tax=Jaculus jaculus TaxID=51337 RepID=A0A8C5LEU6_JACJA
MASGGDQQSQALAKPTFTEAQASAVVESLFGFKVSMIRALPSYDDQNFHVHILRTEDTTDSPNEYVLKISNTESSKDPDLIEMQNDIMMFLKEAGFPTAFVCRTKGDNMTSLMSIKFCHPKLSCLHRENFIWNLKNIPLLEKYVDALGQNRNREIVEQVIQLFKEEIMTKLSHFRECINHGDLNDHNILVEPSKSAFGDADYQVSGILDFGDMSYGYYVFEAAITIMYMMIESKNPIQVGGHVLAGFESIIPLTAVERDSLFLLVCSRFSQSLVMAAYSCQLHPENKEYLMITGKTGWKHLQQMFDMGQKAVEEIWFETVKSYESGISM